MDYFVFAASFFKDWRRTGSLVPSSSFLARRMVRHVDFSKAKVIVELGAGTGAITKEILKKMRKDARLLVFEIDEVFCERLAGLKDDRLEIIKDSAIEMNKYLCGNKAHYIISGLPLANFSSGIKNLILNDIYHNLEQGGEYVQFQYAPRSYGSVKIFFRHVNVGFLFLNIPPAFIYECIKY